MINLTEEDWSKLSHAYGDASDIPSLLKQLEHYPASKTYESEPYFSLWSMLCHQGDVYSASYAAVPYIVKYLESNPNKATIDYFLLPISIEISRSDGRGPKITTEVKNDYFKALKILFSLVPHVTPDTELYARVLSATVAVTNDQQELGEIILELSPDVLKNTREWFDKNA